jgi:hypothetical protein
VEVVRAWLTPAAQLHRPHWGDRLLLGRGFALLAPDRGFGAASVNYGTVPMIEGLKFPGFSETFHYGPMGTEGTHPCESLITGPPFTDFVL